jgi:hypothetical protein
MGAELEGDIDIGPAVCSQQHDVRPHHLAVRGTVATGTSFKDRPFVLRKINCVRGTPGQRASDHGARPSLGPYTSGNLTPM